MPLLPKITLRKRGLYWWFNFRYGRERVRESTGLTDKYKAMMVAEKRAKEVTQHGVNVKSNDFGGFIVKYWELRGVYNRPKTIISRKGALNHFIAFANPRSVSDIDVETCQRFVSEYLLGVRKMKPVSANSNLRSLRHIFNCAELWGYTTRNPFALVPYLKYQSEEKKVLTPSEINRLLVFIRKNEPRYYDLVYFYFLTGMRLEEPSHLKWSNIDYAGKMIVIDWTKTKYNRRVVMLPAVVQMLKSRQAAGEEIPFDIYPDRVKKVIKKIRTHEDVDIPWVSPQAFRRSTTSYLRFMRVPELVITKIMGHTSETALNNYFGMENTELVKQIKPLEKLLPKYVPIKLLDGQKPANLGRRKNPDTLGHNLGTLGDVLTSEKKGHKKTPNP
jgi:integrase